MEGKTKNFSFRLPSDLAQRLEHVKLDQAHKRVPNSEFLVEAVRLYLDHAERFGIDDNLVVNEPERVYELKKKTPAQKNASKHKQTGSTPA